MKITFVYFKQLNCNLPRLIFYTPLSTAKEKLFYDVFYFLKMFEFFFCHKLDGQVEGSISPHVLRVWICAKFY